MPKALGLVETRGLVAAIEAADAMVKTSNVTLIGKEVTNPALITIKIVGDVAAVKASVDAGAAAAARIGELVSIHVIPQPDSQLTALFPEIKDDDDPDGGSEPKSARKRKTDPDKSVENKPDESDKSASMEKSVQEAITSKPSAAGKPEAEEQAAEKPSGMTAEENKGSEKEISDLERNEKLSGKDIPKATELSGKSSSPRKTITVKAPISKPVKTSAPKPKKESDENLFSVTDHLERLRREALGIKEPKEIKPTKPVGKTAAEPAREPVQAQSKLNLEELEKLNVHNLRKTARALEGFPIQGREISRANRRELLDLFKKII